MPTALGNLMFILFSPAIEMAGQMIGHAYGIC